MTVQNSAGVQCLADLGFCRVVLARETSLADLQEISSRSPLELEVFVHGSLCFCYSGQCFFSSMVGGRSGNRGMCAQPCRLTYQLVDDKGQEISENVVGEHMLSAKDLMLLQELPALIDAGVSSLKIEGRMKRPEYVATVTRIYRTALDRAFEDPLHYSGSQDEVRELAQIFNRDFTTGYFYNKPGRDMIGYARPNNRGLAIGRVLRAVGSHVVFRTALPLRNGDGLEFWTSKGGREGLTVHKMMVDDCPVESAEADSLVEIVVSFFVRAGDRIFKTHDETLIKKSEESYSRTSQRRLPVKIKVIAKLGEPLMMVGWGPADMHMTAVGKVPGETAIKHPLTPETLAR